MYGVLMQGKLNPEEKNVTVIHEQKIFNFNENHYKESYFLI